MMGIRLLAFGLLNSPPPTKQIALTDAFFGNWGFDPRHRPSLCKLPILDGQLLFPRMVAAGLFLVTIADSWVEAIPKERRPMPDIDYTDVGAAIEIDA